VQRLVDFWNDGIVPAIPIRASTDPTPVVELALPLLGLGHVHYGDDVFRTAEIFGELGWQAQDLGPRDGLVLMNAVQYMIAMGVEAAAHVDALARALEPEDAPGRASGIFAHRPPMSPTTREITSRGLEAFTDACNGVCVSPLALPEEGPIAFGGATHFESIAFAMDLLTVAARKLEALAQRRAKKNRATC